MGLLLLPVLQEDFKTLHLFLEYRDVGRAIEIQKLGQQ
jgi:hypothetical protein